MKQYLLIIKGEGPTPDSPEQMQQALQAYRQWASGLAAQYVDGQRLRPEGALLPDRKTVITDGPFLESKEIIAGYILVQAKDLDEAIELARGCPLMTHCAIEVRPVLTPPA